MPTSQMSIADVYLTADNPNVKTVFGATLIPNEQTDEGMFFTRHGLVGMTRDGQPSDAAIQRIQKISTQQGKTFRSYLAGFMTGEPDVGANQLADREGQAIPRSHFDIETVAVYSPPLEIPESSDNQEMSIPITVNYHRQLRNWWGCLIEELLITILAGMRGAAENMSALVTPQAAGNGTAQAAEANFTKTMASFHAVNPITAPTRAFCAWHDQLNPSASINPSAATTSDTMAFNDISAIVTYCEERNQQLDGFPFRKANIGSSDGMTKEWVWLVPPSVKRSLIASNLAGSGDAMTFATHQLALAEAGRKKTAFDTNKIGKFYDALFLEYRKLPRYWGGASSDVAIARTLLLAEQAALYGFRSYSIPSNLVGRFDKYERMMSQLGVPVKSWVTPENKGRKFELHSQANIGISKLYWKNLQGIETDKGLASYDCAVPTLGSGVV